MNLLFVLLIFSGAVLVIFMLRRLKFSKIMLSVVSGLAALFCCDLIMTAIGSGGMPLNPYTMSVSAIGGIPGVILLILLKMLIM